MPRSTGSRPSPSTADADAGPDPEPAARDLDWLVRKGVLINFDPDFTDFVIDQIDSDAYRFMRSAARRRPL